MNKLKLLGLITGAMIPLLPVEASNAKNIEVVRFSVSGSVDPLNPSVGYDFRHLRDQNGKNTYVLSSNCTVTIGPDGTSSYKPMGTIGPAHTSTYAEKKPGIQKGCEDDLNILENLIAKFPKDKKFQIK